MTSSSRLSKERGGSREGGREGEGGIKGKDKEEEEQKRGRGMRKMAGSMKERKRWMDEGREEG